MAVRIVQGDCREVLRTLEPASVQVCVTSPPFYGLRAYSTVHQVWGGRADCEHKWGALGSKRYDAKRDGTNPSIGTGGWTGTRGEQPRSAGQIIQHGDTCLRCAAWRGELGSEPDLDTYVRNLVEVFREVKRVLRDDGTCWINLGSSFAVSGKGPTGTNGLGDQELRQGFIGSRGSRIGSVHGDSGHTSGVKPPPGFKAKDLMMVPFFVAEALRQDGWYLRQAITWCKRAPMPESVTDRPTSATEMIFLFSKKAKYFYDQDAVRIPALRAGETPGGNYALKGAEHQRQGGLTNGISGGWAGGEVPANRNLWNYWLLEESYERLSPEWTEAQRTYAESALRDFWTQLLEEQPQAPMAPWWLLSPEPYPDAHFATFPTEIPRRAILAGTSARGGCRECGAPWGRVVERGGYDGAGRANGTVYTGQAYKQPQSAPRGPKRNFGEPTADTTGWAPSCRCEPVGEPVPQVVLDPFSGAGTTGLVASRLGRNYVGVELSPVYADLSRKRIQDDCPLFAEVTA